MCRIDRVDSLWRFCPPQGFVLVLVRLSGNMDGLNIYITIVSALLMSRLMPYIQRVR